MRNHALTFTDYARAAQRFITCFPKAGNVPSAALHLIMDYCTVDWRPNSADEVQCEVNRAAEAALLDSSRGVIVFVSEEDAAVVSGQVDQLIKYAADLYSNWVVDCDFAEFGPA